jgi:hypothetical protein
MKYLNKTHIVLSVWGRDYLETFLEVSLPSQLSSGNLTGLSGRGDISYKIYTRREDEGQLRRHPAFARLESLLDTEILSLDAQSTDNKFAPLIQSHNHAIMQADLKNAALIFLSPDFILANGTLTRLIHLKEKGFRAVLLLTLRLVQDTFVPELLKKYPSKEDQSVTVGPRDLTTLALHYLHPIEKSYFWKKGKSSFPIHAYWPVEGTGLIARCFYLHPIMINPVLRFAAPQITIDADYVDLACPDYSKLYVVRDSDDIACFELSSGSLKDNNARGVPVRYSPWSYAKWSNIHANPVYSSLLHHCYFQSPIKIHNGQPSAEWKKLEASSARTAWWTKWLLAFFRRPGKAGLIFNLLFSNDFNKFPHREDIPRRFHDIDLYQDISGTGWGEAERTRDGQKFRWIGPENRACLFISLARNRKRYLINTRIYTALTESLFDLTVSINGLEADLQRIVRRGDDFWHLCFVPKQALKTANTPVEISYQIKTNKDGPLMALSRVTCQPSGFLPYFICKMRRWVGSLIKKFKINLLVDYV